MMRSFKWTDFGHLGKVTMRFTVILNVFFFFFWFYFLSLAWTIFLWLLETMNFQFSHLFFFRGNWKLNTGWQKTVTQLLLQFEFFFPSNQIKCAKTLQRIEWSKNASLISKCYCCDFRNFFYSIQLLLLMFNYSKWCMKMEKNV